jgi:hypothetical protein
MEKISIISKTAALIVFLAAGSVTKLTAQHHQACEHEHGTEKHQMHRISTVPAGVMGDHVHAKGSMMVSYMYMGMNMSGMNGSSAASHHNLNEYEMVPETMFMQMHMIGLMTSVSDRVTLMGMIPLLDKTMDHAIYGGHHHAAMRSSGLGDIRLTALTPVIQKGDHRVILSGGISIPTGSVSVKSDGMHGVTRMGYGMQHGSGTADLLTGVTWAMDTQKIGVGGQVRSVFRTTDNRMGYRLGNEVEGNVWAGIAANDYTALMLRLQTYWQDAIRGMDPNINAGSISTADPDNYGGTIMRLSGGAAISLEKLTPFRGRLAGEAGIPVHQHSNGMQMAESWMVTGSLQIVL